CPRCPHFFICPAAPVEVAVSFNGETVHDRFGPGTTVARVKTWAAERKFGMTPQEAGEHVLQVAGTKDRPHPGTHLGSIAACPACRLSPPPPAIGCQRPPTSPCWSSCHRAYG